MDTYVLFFLQNNVLIFHFRCPDSSKKRYYLTKLCAINGSITIPPDIYSNDHCMYLRFETTSDIQMGGRFVAKYEQLDKAKPLVNGNCNQMSSRYLVIF